jgi:hypothetical protein
MVESVVYIIGAGFSAPLGLPVVRNFIQMAKDLAAEQPDDYSHFADVFRNLRDMAWAKTYYRTNLENIEEALSLLEMSEAAGPQPLKSEFTRMICDVISHYTPQVVSMDLSGAPLGQWLFGAGQLRGNYGMFAAGLCGFVTRRTTDEFPEFSPNRGMLAEYTVVSLNYDRVLEQSTEFLRSNWRLPEQFDFRRYPSTLDVEPKGRCILAKLHGSVETGPTGIIPPTANKSWNSSILGAWQVAFSALAGANRIRILGYSLPDNDAFFRYLLKAAGTKASNLKSIDVVCLDPDGDVRLRYEDFIETAKLRFRGDLSTEHYLDAVRGATNGVQTDDPLVVDLEKAHRSLFG